MDYIIIDEPGYGGRLNIKTYNTVLFFYTNHQIKVRYPNMNLWIIGEINNKAGIQCGTVENLDATPFPVYRQGSHHKITEKVVGYVYIDGFRFLAVVKNVFFLRLFLFILTASMFGFILCQ